MPRLSVLDQSPIRTGATPADAIRETLALAEACDRLGYHRYWLAEHHATPGLAGSAPEVLIGQVAARTSKIRVGSGGVMLSHYSPLKVAESFRVLEALFPGRIDLGVGRAPGSDQRTARALRDGPGGAERFPAQVADLIEFLHDRIPPGHRHAGVRAMPVGPTAPEVWLLGSTDQSAACAAHFGTAFSFAHFISDDGGAGVTRGYVRAFRPSPELAEPRASVACFVVCAETEAAAMRLSQSRDLFLVRLYTGRPGPYPSVGEAQEHPYTAEEREIVRHARRRTIVGTPSGVREQLLVLSEAYGVDELVIVTITEDFASRLRSYELLAEVFADTRQERVNESATVRAPLPPVGGEGG